MLKEGKQFIPRHLQSQHAAGTLGSFSLVSTTVDVQFPRLGL